MTNNRLTIVQKQHPLCTRNGGSLQTFTALWKIQYVTFPSYVLFLCIFFMTLAMIKKCLFTLLLRCIDLSIMQSKYQVLSKDSIAGVQREQFFL